MSGSNRIKTRKTKMHKHRIDKKRIRRKRQEPTYENWERRARVRWVEHQKRMKARKN